MKMKGMAMLPFVVMGIVGCDENERLARYAEQAMESQQKQNDTIARQSEKVVDESHQLAETAKELVTMDAQARSEMLQAQHELNEGIHTERVNVDRQREVLEQERRAIATQRNRDPIVAAALRSTGMIVACALPLLLVGYALWQMNQKVDESTELGNLLIDELTSPQPTLLPPPNRLCLTKAEFATHLDQGKSV